MPNRIVNLHQLLVNLSQPEVSTRQPVVLPYGFSNCVNIRGMKRCSALLL